MYRVINISHLTCIILPLPPNHGGHNQGLLMGRRENLGIRLPYLTCTRVAVDLFSNRSQMTSKCGKKGSGTRAAGKCVTDVFTTFWCSLWSITTQTYSNMECIKFCFIHAMIRKEKKTDTHLPALYCLTVRGFLLV